MPLPTPTINGTAAAHEQPQRYGTDDSGPYLIRTWHGTRSAIATQYATCVAAGAIAEVRQGIAVDILEARYATDGGNPGDPANVIDTWEFFANVVEKDMLESDIASIAGITTSDKRMIQLHTDPDTAPLLVGTTAQDVFNLKMSGVRAVRVMQPVLRHTQTVSDSYSVKASLTNVGKIYTTAQLQSAESLPLDILFNLPSNTSNHSGQVYAWLKLHPTVRAAARQKVQIEQEWEYGLWASLLYTAVT